MKRIVYTRPDGGVSIVVPAPKAQRKDESEAEFLVRLRAKVVPLKWCAVRIDGLVSVVPHMPGQPDPGGETIHVPKVSVCDEADIPADRYFRDAFCWPDEPDCWPVGAVGISKHRAETLQMVRIRRVRDAELKRLDVEYQRADETGDQAKQAVAKRKQALRDLPDTFDLTQAKTPEALKAMWPNGLPHA